VFFLGKGRQNTCAPVSCSAALARLLVASFLSYHSRPVTTDLLRTLEAAVALDPMNQLDFVPDPTVVSFLLDQEGISPLSN
jgi:hypothetical protein